MPTNVPADEAPRTPEQLMDRFRRCVHERSLERLMDLYEPSALFTPQPGVSHRGLDAIRAALSEMLGLAPRMETRVTEVHEADDLALVIVEWSLHGTAPDGTPVQQRGRSSDVLRRRPDGSWRVVIDRP